MRTVSNFRIGALLLAGLLGLGLVSACSNENDNGSNEDDAPSPTAYAYSMLAPGTGSSPVIFARIVYDALKQTCPVLSGSDGSSLATLVRPKNPDSNGAQVTDDNFPVTVCEAVMQPDVAYSNSKDGISLAKVTLQPKQVQVYGDSGCKDSDCPNGSPSKHFQALAKWGSGQPHDLILHMGDYNYRGTSGHFAESPPGNKIWAYDAGDVPNPLPTCTYNDKYYSQNALNSPKPDGWQYWKPDFFEAAKTLLPTAPWVFARGNHELCSRAGVGWFYFFGPGSSMSGSGVSQEQCPYQGDFNNPPTGAGEEIEMIPPYMVTLSDFQVWVMDSANACDTGSKNPLTPQYTQQYEQLTQQTKNKLPTWVMTHRPIWGYQSDGAINNMLQTALAQTSAGEMPDPVSLSLAGHMHIYESLTFFDSAGAATGRPPQIVIGDSGVSLGTGPGSGADPDLDGQIAQYNSNDKLYGYMQMSVGVDGGWNGQLSTADGSAIVTCDSANPANGMQICLPIIVD